MAKLDGEFDSEVEGVTLLPEGDYSLIVKKTEFKDTKQGNGIMLNFIYEVVEGEHLGSSIFDGMIYMHTPLTDAPEDVAKSAKARKMGRERLAALVKACGLAKIEDSDELKDIIFKAKVGIQPGQGTFADSNRVQKFYPAETSAAVSSHTTGTSKTTEETASPEKKGAPAKSKKEMPWNKK